MQDLSRFYQDVLHFGLLNLREAVLTRNFEWAKEEAEFLHNIPSLIGESNTRRHLYFWDSERAHYLEWCETNGPEEARARQRRFYEPLLREAAPMFAQLTEEAAKEVSDPQGRHAG